MQMLLGEDLRLGRIFLLSQFWLLFVLFFVLSKSFLQYSMVLLEDTHSLVFIMENLIESNF